MSKTLILASTSPRRKELLEQFGYVFQVIPSHVSEILDPKCSPAENAIELARQKADEVSKRTKGIILAADTLVVLGNVILGKPKDIMDAQRMLSKLSGSTHQVITGFIILDTRSRREVIKSVSTQVKFKKLSQKWIQDYIRNEHTLDKAGAYAVQESGDSLIEHIDGSFANVMGLPIEEVSRLLRDFEIFPTK